MNTSRRRERMCPHVQHYALKQLSLDSLLSKSYLGSKNRFGFYYKVSISRDTRSLYKVLKIHTWYLWSKTSAVFRNSHSPNVTQNCHCPGEGTVIEGCRATAHSLVPVEMSEYKLQVSVLAAGRSISLCYHTSEVLHARDKEGKCVS